MNSREAQCEAMRSLVQTLRRLAKDYRAMGDEAERRRCLSDAWWWRQHERDLRQPLWPELEQAA